MCVFETKSRDLNDEDPDGLEGEHLIAILNIGLVKVKKDRYPEHYLDTLEMDLIRKVEENRKRKRDSYVGNSSRRERKRRTVLDGQNLKRMRDFDAAENSRNERINEETAKIRRLWQLDGYVRVYVLYINDIIRGFLDASN